MLLQSSFCVSMYLYIKSSSNSAQINLRLNLRLLFFQVSRSTGILSHFVNLHIVIPEAFILGSDEHHVDVGSIINLVCIIEKVRYIAHCTRETFTLHKHERAC